MIAPRRITGSLATMATTLIDLLDALKNIRRRRVLFALAKASGPVDLTRLASTLDTTPGDLADEIEELLQAGLIQSASPCALELTTRVEISPNESGWRVAVTADDQSEVVIQTPGPIDQFM